MRYEYITPDSEVVPGEVIEFSPFVQMWIIDACVVGRVDRDHIIIASGFANSEENVKIKLFADGTTNIRRIVR